MKYNIKSIFSIRNIFIDYVSAPIASEINISMIPKEKNIYDIDKYFMIKITKDTHIYCCYNIYTDKITIFKIDVDIKNYCILFDHLILFCDAYILLINIDDKKFLKIKYDLEKLIHDASVLYYILNTDEYLSKYVKITKNNDIYEELINNDPDIVHRKDNVLYCYNCHNNTSIYSMTSNKLSIIQNNNIKYLELPTDYIVSIYNISLNHILVCSVFGMKYIYYIIELNDFQNAHYFEFNTIGNIIEYLNTEFYNTIRNSIVSI